MVGHIERKRLRLRYKERLGGKQILYLLDLLQKRVLLQSSFAIVTEMMYPNVISDIPWKRNLRS